MADKRIAPKLRITVNIVSENSLDAPGKLPEGLSEADLKALRQLEPKVLAWLSASKANAEAFAADPLKAIAAFKGGPHDRALDKLAALGAASLKKQAPWPDVQIERMTVRVGRSGQ